MSGRRAVLLVLLVSLGGVAGTGPVLAWGPAGHAAIALGVAQEQGLSFVTGSVRLQAVYGSSCPDFAWEATGPLNSALGAATHDAPGCLEPWDRAGSKAEKAFAWGWLSHNQIWGADHYAHLESPLAPDTAGYVVDRAALLAAAESVDMGTAHNFVEVAVDLLLDQEHPEYGLAGLVSTAASSRDSRIPGLLVRCYSDVPGANRLNLRTFESGLRAGMIVYGQTLALPTGADEAAFVTGLAASSGLSLAKATACLATAKALCQDPAADYEAAITATIARVSTAPWPALR